jgi:hypothetical protein
MAMTDLPAQLALGSRFRALQTGCSPLTILYSSGNSIATEVPKTYLTKDIVIRLTGDLVVTMAATIRPEAPLGLLQKIELVGDGSETIWSITGRDAYRLAQISFGKAGELVPPAGGVATNPFQATVMISAEAANMAVPVDSYLDLREFEKTELRVQWGAAATVFSAGAATISATTQVECYANQSTEGLGSIGFRRFLSFDNRQINATQTDFTFLIPRSGLLAGILFRTDRDSAPVDDIINFITLTSDSSHDHIKRRSFRSLQAENMQRYQLDGGPAANGGRITGYAYLDLIEDGRMAAAINTEALNELKLTLDVTLGGGTTREMQTTYVFYRALRRA